MTGTLLEVKGMDRCRTDRPRHTFVSIAFVAVAAVSLVFASLASAHVAVTEDDLPQAQATATDKARWLTYPTCTVTNSTLTCTGKAGGISRPNTNPFYPGSKSPVQASITTQVLYTCEGVVGVNATLYAAAYVHNGETFTLSITPDPLPNTGVHFWCGSPEITWIPIFYDVSVGIGWETGPPSSGLDAPQRLLVLTGPIGTVSPP
jgi:hypothetical protein